ncbi:MAG: hypothetical protein QN157_12180 [Armatimonadota bacterium]|nr:hypothetical protein [Armatimonadota bacterium]
MRCARCGAENPQGKIVCARCGARLRASAGPAAVADRPEEFMRWLRADLVRLAVVTAVVAAGALVLGGLLR